MKKKLMAVAVAGAVAGAVAAPELALAQTTIYGKFNVQYGFVSQMDTSEVEAAAAVPPSPPGTPGGSLGSAAVAAQPSRSRESADGFNSGASYVGIRGEEKLGGGNAVWYQCETRARWGVDTNPSQAASGICDRNSALGIKGGFGNFWVGRWDTAMETVSGTTRIVDSTGWAGVQHMLTEDQAGLISFAQRVQNSFNYESPSWSGFTIGLSTTSSGAAVNTAVSTAANTDKKGRIYSGYAKYAAGPLAAYVGYEKHDDNQTVATGGEGGSDEDMVTFGASYVLGPIKLGIVYTGFEAKDSAGDTLERDSWQVAGDWKVTPAGTIRFAYTEAGEYKGTAGSPDTGAKQYSIGYIQAFSKRTSGYVAYTIVDNDSFGTYNFAGFNTLVKEGDKGSVFHLGAVHTF